MMNSDKMDLQFKAKLDIEAKELESVEMDEDVYCYSICANLLNDQFSPDEQESYFKRCILVFIFQTLLVYYYLIYGIENDTTATHILDTIAPPSFRNQAVRFMCSYLLHLMILPEYRQGLSIMSLLFYSE